LGECGPLIKETTIIYNVIAVTLFFWERRSIFLLTLELKEQFLEMAMLLTSSQTYGINLP